MNQSKAFVNPGDKVHDFRIESVVFRSTIATVYRATDLRDNRTVAIKIPNPDVENDPTFADWFRREQEVSATLDHPGVMRVINDIRGAEPFTVMEWFEGKPLRQLLTEEQRLSTERSARIAVAICDALQYLHGRGIVHGDLRPENIIVGNDDQIKLIEFSGAAKAKARRLTLAKVAQISGASDYISPEEALGKRVDARSDIYALGIILYEMITGKQPFPQHDPVGRVTSYPVPPREINPAISPQIQEVIYRALERNPQNRYARAAMFSRDILYLDQVGISDRVELRDWSKQRSSRARKILFYAMLALIPIVILAVLLYVAGH
jgi:eukaryotic-like serine/threonine-protein kinase